MTHLPPEIPDLGREAIDRLISRFRSDPIAAGILKGLHRGAQYLETQTSAVFRSFLISDAVGAQLDRLGRVVGQVRRGSDATFRRWISARSAALRSIGSIPDIETVASLVTSGFRIVLCWPASLIVEVTEPISDLTTALAIGEILEVATAGGVGISVVQASPEYFAFGAVGSDPLEEVSGGFGSYHDPDVGGLLAGELARNYEQAV